MVVTRHVRFDNLIPPLCCGSLEDLIHTILMLDGNYMETLVTHTVCLFFLVQFDGYPLHLTLEISDIGVPLTKLTFGSFASASSS